MSVLCHQLAEVLLPGMHLSPPIEHLFGWIEENGFFVDRENGRIGFLYSEAEFASESGDMDDMDDSEHSAGTRIGFFAEGNVNMPYWFGHNRPEVISRLCVFAKTGGEGSMAAFWLDDDGNQKIVHLGSGSGSLLTCVLADDPVDFIRLLAIGYDEICWSSRYSTPPDAAISDGSACVHPNMPFREWVERTFSVTIPETASEIVKHPTNMGDPDSPDLFCRWTSRSAA